jgi:hypothetical protein
MMNDDLPRVIQRAPSGFLFPVFPRDATAQTVITP